MAQVAELSETQLTLPLPAVKCLELLEDLDFRTEPSRFCPTYCNAMGFYAGDVSAMTKEDEYRACAAACVDLANRAANDDDKKHDLAMAEAWLSLADRVQRGVQQPEPNLWHPALQAKLGLAT